MAIVKMKKLRVMAMADSRDALLRELLRLGCVEISEPDGRLADPAWAALLRRDSSRLAETKNELGEANAALDALKRYGGVKEGMFLQRRSIGQEEFLSQAVLEKGRTVSKAINASLQDIARLQSEEGRLLSRRAGLEPWVSLDMPLELGGTANAAFRLGTFPGAAEMAPVQTELAASDAAAELYEISADRQQRCCLLICHRADEEKALEVLRPHGFSVTAFQGLTGTASENIAALDQAVSVNRKSRQEAEAAIAKLAPEQDRLRAYADRLAAEAAEDQNAERLLTDGTIVFFEGWAPTENMDKVSALLEKAGCAWEASDPTEDEVPEVPVQLKNNWFTKPLNMVTDMYSLPAYGTVDPNPLMAPFFILFYGMMMADMGYGLIMMGLSAFIMKKAKPNGATMRYMIPLMGLCGVSTFIWGALTGGFFGDLIPQIRGLLTGVDPKSVPLWSAFDPLSDAVPVLIGALILGVVQVFTGMIVSMVMKFRRGEAMSALCGEGAWFLAFIAAGAGFALGNVQMGLIAALVILVLTQGYGKKGFGIVTGIFGSLYNGITGYFSDILSYSRLMALMLAGAVVAQVFNQLGAMTGHIIPFIVIAVIGNALNFALNILGCYVHDMRLQCLEFFGRFYEDGGKPFRPLNIEPKYVDIEK